MKLNLIPFNAKDVKTDEDLSTDSFSNIEDKVSMKSSEYSESETSQQIKSQVSNFENDINYFMIHLSHQQDITNMSY